MLETIMLSGGFDPLHIGHLRMIKAAAKYGEVIIALNSDDWLIRKKGFYFQTWEHRKEIMLGLRDVAIVVDVNDKDGTVQDAISRYRPTYFGNSGDRKVDNTPELTLCHTLGVVPVFNLDDSAASVHSSHIITRQKVQRDWGSYSVLYDSPNVRVKLLEFKDMKFTSDQTHEKRTEFLFDVVNKGVTIIPPNTRHTIGGNPMIEVQVGEVSEDDIRRY